MAATVTITVPAQAWALSSRNNRLQTPGIPVDTSLSADGSAITLRAIRLDTQDTPSSSFRFAMFFSGMLVDSMAQAMVTLTRGDDVLVIAQGALRGSNNNGWNDTLTDNSPVKAWTERLIAAGNPAFTIEVMLDGPVELPSVNDATASLGRPFDLTLPAAMCGVAPFTYTLTGSIPRGLVWNAATRTLSGVALGAPETVTLTYGVTDSDTPAGTHNVQFDLTTAVPTGAVRIVVDSSDLGSFTASQILAIISESVPAAFFADNAAGRITGITVFSSGSTQDFYLAFDGALSTQFAERGVVWLTEGNREIRLLSGVASNTARWTPSNLDDALAWIGQRNTRNDLVLLMDSAPPVTLSAVDAPNVALNLPYTYTLPEAGGGSPPFTYALEGVPDGMTFDPMTRVLSGRVDGAARIISLTYTVTDSMMATDSEAFALIIIEVSAPSIPTTPIYRGQAGSSFARVLPPAEGGALPYIYSLTGSDIGLEFDPATRELAGVIEVTASGGYRFTYRVVDIYGQSFDLPISLQVAPDLRPKVRVEVDWDGDGLYGNAESNITDNVLEITTCKRGRDFSGDPIGRVVAGIFQCQLLDEDGLYDRFNASSPLHEKVIPGRGVRVEALTGSGYVRIWTGILDDMHPRQLHGRQVMRMRALGTLSTLARTPIAIGIQDDVTEAAAMGQIFQAAGLSAVEQGSVFGVRVLPRWWVSPQSALRAATAIERPALGRLWETRLGAVQYDSVALQRHADATAQVDFSTAAPGATERETLRLSAGDPIENIVSVITARVRRYVEDETPQVLWTWDGGTQEIAAGASWSVTAVRVSPATDELAIDWTMVGGADVTATARADGTGGSRLSNLEIEQDNGAASSRLTFTNTGSAPLFITSLHVRGQVVREQSPYELQFENDTATARYGVREVVLRDSHLSRTSMEAQAQYALDLFASPRRRIMLTFADEANTYIPEVQDVVRVREPDAPRARYVVEAVDHRWRRGQHHQVELTLLEEQTAMVPSADAIAPTVTIDTVPDAREGTTAQLSVTLSGGVYDGLEYAWTVSHGALDNAAISTPTWTRPLVDADTEVTIRVTITATGTGEDDTAMATTTTMVEDQPPPAATAPMVTIDTVPSGLEQTRATLGATLSGGNWDRIVYAWTVSHGALNDASAAAPVWTRPATLVDVEVTIELTVTVHGDGVMALDNTMDDANGDTSTTALFTRLPVVAPTVTIDDVPTGLEETQINLVAIIGGGTFDVLEYEWAVTGGLLDDDEAASPVWTRPSVDANTDYTISLTVTAKGTGANALADSEVEIMADAETTTVVQFSDALAPTAVTIDAIAGGTEGTQVSLSAQLVGGIYDRVDYEWSVNAGRLDDTSVASPVWTRPLVDADGEATITLEVTVHGDGTNARSATSAMASGSRTAEVWQPDAVAPTVAINAIAAGNEGATVRLSAALTGGVYDNLVYAWSVSGGRLNDASAVSPTWTRPQVSADGNYTISLTVTANGTGTVAHNGTDAMANASRAARVRNVLPVAAAPTMAIAAVANGVEGTTESLSATISGGQYDRLVYAWSASAGQINNPALENPTWTRPAVNINTAVTISLTVTARGDGVTTRDGTSDRATDTDTTQVWQPAEAPTVAIDAIADGGEGGEVALSATVTGGRYDALDYAWTADDGTLEDEDTATPTWTRPLVVGNQNVTLRLTVTARGTGNNIQANTSAQAMATRAATVLDILPVAVAPTMAIAMVGDGREGTAEQLSTSISGGTYDRLTYAWSVTAGALNNAALEAPTWTRPMVDAEQNVTIRLTVTAHGDGTIARDGTTATASDTDVARVFDAALRLSYTTPGVYTLQWPSGNARATLMLIGGSGGDGGTGGTGGEGGPSIGTRPPAFALTANPVNGGRPPNRYSTLTNGGDGGGGGGDGGDGQAWLIFGDLQTTGRYAWGAGGYGGGGGGGGGAGGNGGDTTVVRGTTTYRATGGLGGHGSAGTAGGEGAAVTFDEDVNGVGIDGTTRVGPGGGAGAGEQNAGHTGGQSGAGGATETINLTGLTRGETLTITVGAGGAGGAGGEGGGGGWTRPASGARGDGADGTNGDNGNAGASGSVVITA